MTRAASPPTTAPPESNSASPSTFPRARGGESITRWVKVSAYGLLASRTAESVRKGDRVTVIAEDLLAEAWLSTDNEPPAPAPG